MPLTNIDNLIGRRNGIIKEIYALNIDSTEPDMHTFVAERGILDWEIPEEDAVRYGAGGGFTKIQALLSSCGEVIERYCSSFISKNSIKGSFKELKNIYSLLDPNQIKLFSEKQYNTENFPFKKITEESVLEWVTAYSYKKQAEIYVPAFMVYLPYNKYEFGALHAPSSSAGLACADTVEEATEKAILELIERDAFTVFWLNKLSPPRIVIDDLPNSDQLKERFKFLNIKYDIFDITSDFQIPITAVFCFGDSSFGYVAAMGLGTSFDSTHSLKKALIENALGRRAIYFYRKKSPNKKYLLDFKDVTSFHDHGYLYSTDQSLKENLSFLLDFSKNVTNITKKTVKSGLIDLVLSRGFDVITKDLTTHDIAENGMRVVRAIIPGLAQLHGIHSLPFLGSPRLYQPAKVFSWSSKKISTEEEIKHFPPHMLA